MCQRSYTRRGHGQKVSKEQHTHWSIGATMVGDTGLKCQFHWFQCDCVWSDGLIWCVSIWVSKFLKCTWWAAILCCWRQNVCCTSFPGLDFKTFQNNLPVWSQRENLNHSRVFHCSSVFLLAIPVIAFSDYLLYTEEIAENISWVKVRGWGNRFYC